MIPEQEDLRKHGCFVIDIKYSPWRGLVIITSAKAMLLAVGSIDIHCHGVGKYDFTEIANIDLADIESTLAERRHKAILTLYLPKNNFNAFLKLVDQFHNGKRQGRYQYIQGFGIEGPLLASHGGTPHKGVWLPSKAQWKAIASCGKKGLVYVILSPDADIKSWDNFDESVHPENVEWIIRALLEGSVLPAPGHFTKSEPQESAKSLQRLFNLVQASGRGPTVTDHLFNDMPRNFKHAWRSAEEKKTRTADIQYLQIENWTLDNLEMQLGPVPAVMIENAKNGNTKIALNFDGEHVDLAIVKKVVQLVGAENLMMMTDSIESKRLAGRQLSTKEGSTLLYQDEDVVAAGSQSVIRQISNMLQIGLTNEEILWITQTTIANLLENHQEKYAQAVSV